MHACLQRVILPQCIDGGLDRAQGVAQQKGLMGVDAPRAGGGRQQLAGAIAACGSDYKGRLMKVSAVLCAMPRLLMTLADAIAACGSDY